MKGRREKIEWAGEGRKEGEEGHIRRSGGGRKYEREEG